MGVIEGVALIRLRGDEVIMFIGGQDGDKTKLSGHAGHRLRGEIAHSLFQHDTAVLLVSLVANPVVGPAGSIVSADEGRAQDRFGNQ